MRVLFVCRGNKADTISPIIRAQALSLVREGVDLAIYPVQGGSAWSYFKNIRILRKTVNKSDFDIIHAHFGFTAMMCSIAVPLKKLVVSLMGSDVYYSKWIRFVYLIFSRFFWAHTIVKTTEMARIMRSVRVSVIPNGVNLEVFYPVEKAVARKLLGLPPDKHVLLFPSYPFRKEKNYDFINRVSAGIKDRILLNFNYEPPEKINLYYNATDVMLMASSFEGSPNTVKEAMACNCPIVSVRAGDIEWVTENTEGCYISNYDEKEYLEKIKDGLRFAAEKGKTNGRERIKHLALDSISVAQKIISVYNRISLQRL